MPCDRTASESPVCLCEQEAGLPHLRAATSLRGGGAYPSPGVWIHAVRKHLPRTAAQEGMWTLGRESELFQKSLLFRNQTMVVLYVFD